MNKFTMLINGVAGLVFGYLMVTLVKGDYPMLILICVALVWLLPMFRIGYLANKVEFHSPEDR